MKMENDAKIKIFISSRCGGEHSNINRLANEDSMDISTVTAAALKTSYDLIRGALKLAFEETGIIYPYVFEHEPASSSSAEQNYFDALDECHLCLFLLDNFDKEIPLGVFKEIDRAKSNKKKSIYIFLNDPLEEKTSIQKSLSGSNNPQYFEIHDVRAFITEGYKSVVKDVINIYESYCRGKLIRVDEKYSSTDSRSSVLADETTSSIIITSEESSNKQDISSINIITDTDIDRDTFTKLGKTKNKLLSLFYQPLGDSIQTAKLDNVCLTILEWLLGEREFKSVDIQFILQALEEIQPQELHRIVIERWLAISNYYSGNIEEAIGILESAYELCLKDKSIPEWLVSNILIDIQNLNINKGRINNEIFLFDQRIEKQRSVIIFPLADRFTQQVDEDILDSNFKSFINNPNIISLENIDHVLGYITSYLFTALYYGSFTHIILTLKEVQRVLVDVIQKDDKLSYKLNLIRLSILRGDEGDFEKIMHRFKSSLSHCTSREVLAIYRLADKKPMHFLSLYWRSLIFGEIGYYLSDEDYTIATNEIFNIINDVKQHGDPNITLGTNLIKALQSNQRRLSQERIIQFAIEIINFRYFRFFDLVFELLHGINYSELPSQLIGELVRIVKQLLDNEDSIKKQPSDKIRKFLIRVRKTNKDYSAEIDNIAMKHYPDFYKQEYHLEVVPGQRFTHIQRYLENIKSRNQIQGKNNKWIGFVDRPYLIIKNIIQFDRAYPPESQLKQLLEEISFTLFSEKQTFTEKNDAIRLLLFLKAQETFIDFDWPAYYSTLKDNIGKIGSGHSVFFLGQESDLLIKLQLAILRSTFGEDCSQDLLEILALTNNASIIEIINSLAALEEFIMLERCTVLKQDSLVSMLVQFITSFCFHVHRDIRFYTVGGLFQLLDTRYGDFIANLLTKMMDDDDFDIKRAIVNKSKFLKEKYESSFNYIIGKAMIDNNYLVRKAAEEISRRS